MSPRSSVGRMDLYELRVEAEDPVTHWAGVLGVDPEAGSDFLVGRKGGRRGHRQGARSRGAAVELGQPFAGGQDAGGTSLTSAELYDPATGTFTATTSGMNESRNSHTATLLRNGKVFIAGGSLYNFSSELNSAELYNPADGSFTAIIMNNTRSRHAATLLPNGKVLLSGG